MASRIRAMAAMVAGSTDVGLWRGAIQWHNELLG